MPMQTTDDLTVLIPSFQPDHRLEPYVERLINADIAQIVIVDDGSGTAYDDVFISLAKHPAVTVLRYPDNRGKGYALRHGLRYILDEGSDCRFIITADSDGQHKVEDILRMSLALRADSRGILLGVRDFSAAHVPPKSRMGNRITRKIFQALYGQRIDDTQTGLRGFTVDKIEPFLTVKGNRYEYEMNQLIYCSIAGIPIRSLPIETVYEDNNAGSHFRAFRDSYRIYRVIMARFVRFVLSSMICFLLDYGIYVLLSSLLETHEPKLGYEISFLFIHFVPLIGIAAGVARVISATVNYAINKRLVFESRAGALRAFIRYAVTAVLIIALSAGIVSTLLIGLGWSDKITKIPVDLLLFFISYYLQRKWVFGGGGKGRTVKNNG